MKQRFSSLDVKVIAHELSASLCGLRVQNIYDLSSRIFLFKFRTPNSREQLVVDSGFRCHLTSFARTTAAEPSAFVARLRKTLKTRRVTAVEQVGTDRVIEFTFSDGMYRLFLEFYAGGNVILCDKELKVIALLRRVPAGAGEDEVKEGMTYALEKRQNYDGVPPLSLEYLRTSLQKQVERAATESVAKKAKRKQGDGLRRALAMAVPEFPPILLEHAFRARQFDTSIAPDEVLKDDDKLQRLLDVLEEAKQQSDDIVASTPSKGYIIAKPAKKRPSTEAISAEGSDADKENVALVYEDFHPFRPRQFEGQADTTIIEIIGFNKAVDDFFSSLESQKLESRLTERELNAQRRIEAARQDHEKRIGGLQQVQELNVRKAQALEANLQRVEEATAAVNGLIAQGMDWEDIGSLIQTEKARNNPVATIIKLPLKLEENTITLLLGEEEQLDDDDEADFKDESASESSDDEGDEDKENPNTKPSIKESNLLSIDIDLALTGWANAGQYYDQKKTAAVKEEKTAQASSEALKRHEKKVNSDLKKGLAQEKEVLRAVRQQLWFEKFLYFISSEGYLVIGARDKTQSDIIYNRHLGKGDVWVHADLEGASHIVVKNRPGLQDSPIPPSTLAQAGNLCVCSSAAWDSKAVMGAWWVKADQVSKLAPNGDFLEQGAFEIKGKKEHLPPAQLLLGFGVMFKLSDASMAKRNKNRIPLGDISGGPTQTDEAKTAEASNDQPLTPVHTDKEDEDSDQEYDNQSEKGYKNPLQANGTDDPASDHEDGEEETADEEQEGDEEDIIPAASDVADEQHEVEGGDDDDTKTAAAQAEDEDAATTTSVAGQEKAAPQVRGKHGKKAKMKSKYAWQDEEDRTLALRLLGSSKGQEKKAAAAEEKELKEAADAAAKERRREQHRIAQQKGKEAEQARQRRLAGEKGADDEDEDGAGVENLAVVDNLVGMPKPGDEIEDLLVVCAPWDSIGPRFRWRTKMQPGTQKKGKALREILSSWSRDIATRDKKRMPPQDDDRHEEEKMLRREGDLIKSIKDVEVVGCVPVKSCRVVISGGGDSSKGGAKGKGSGGGGGGGKGAKSSRGGRGSKRK